MPAARFKLALVLFASLGSLCLPGCSSIFEMIPASTSPVSVSAGAAASIASVTNFGDSITCGVGATSAADGYASLLDAAIAEPSGNLCRGGDQAADMTRLWIDPDATPTATGQQLYTVLIGTNDANHCGPSSGCIANWSHALQAGLAWLAIPSTDKLLAANCTSRSGSWSNDLSFGLATTGNGATLSFNPTQTVAGHRLYVGYRVFDSAASNPGTAILSVDGMPVAMLSSAVSTGQTLLTVNGTTDTIFVTSVPLGVAGPHTVRIASTSSQGGLFSLQWIGVAGADYTTSVVAPRVLEGSIILSSSATLNSTIALYNAQLATLVDSLTADGLRISIAPTAAAIDPSTDLFDVLHPNNAGHLKIARTFAGSL